MNIEEAISNIEEIKEFLLGLNYDGEHTFEKLNQLRDKWPVSVDSRSIVDENSEEEKEQRSQVIWDLLFSNKDLSESTVLDYGCGEGHLAKLIFSKAKKTIGYDINKTGNLPWESNDTILLTTDFDLVSRNKYDVIILYDVIDHVEVESPELLMEKIRSLCADNGEVFVRCHPWMSRHGGHLYKNLNLAFAHLVFTEEELQYLGCNSMNIHKITKPLHFYRNLFKNFAVENEKISWSFVEPFFKENALVLNRILRHTGFECIPEFQMKQDFVDYQLRNKK